jgi:hypothetical protein
MPAAALHSFPIARPAALPSAAPGVGPVVWAEVRARTRTTRFARLGAGRTVVLLAAPTPEAEPRWAELARGLAARCRVVLPELPTTAAGPARGASPTAPCTASCTLEWLRAFVEGLGSERVALVADEPFWLPALALGSAYADVCERVALVRDEGAAAPLLEAGEPARPSAAVWLWRWRGSDPAAFGAVARWVAGDAAPALAPRAD